MAERWEVTLHQLLEFARKERGIVPVPIHGPTIEGLCLELDGLSYPLPPDLGEDAILPLEYLLSLCRFLSIPADDFGLDQNEDD